MNHDKSRFSFLIPTIYIIFLLLPILSLIHI